MALYEEDKLPGLRQEDRFKEETIINEVKEQPDVSKPRDIGNYNSNINTGFGPDDARYFIGSEGSPWFVDWYSNVVGEDNALERFQTSLSSVYQQTELVRQQCIMVTESLTPSQNESTREYTMVGAGLLPPNIIPNVGNSFVADIGDGRKAILSIITCERPSILKGSWHRITYGVIGYLTAEVESAISASVIRTYYFDYKRAVAGLNPTLNASEVTGLRLCEKRRAFTVARLLRDNWDRHLKQLTYKKGSERVYDGFYHDALTNLLNLSEFNIDGIRHVYHYGQRGAQTLFSCILTAETDLMWVDSNVKIDSPAWVAGDSPELLPLWALGIKAHVNVEGGAVKVPREHPDVKMPIMYPANSFGTYIFSPYFYTRNYAYMSRIELLVIKLIDRDTLTVTDLDGLYEYGHTLTDGDYYYFALFYILLCNVIISGNRVWN